MYTLSTREVLTFIARANTHWSQIHSSSLYIEFAHILQIDFFCCCSYHFPSKLSRGAQCCGSIAWAENHINMQLDFLRNVKDVFRVCRECTVLGFFLIQTYMTDFLPEWSSVGDSCNISGFIFVCFRCWTNTLNRKACSTVYKQS